MIHISKVAKVIIANIVNGIPICAIVVKLRAVVMNVIQRQGISVVLGKEYELVYMQRRDFIFYVGLGNIDGIVFCESGFRFDGD